MGAYSSTSMSGIFQSRRNPARYLRYAADGSPTLVNADSATTFELVENALTMSGEFVAGASDGKQFVFKTSSKANIMWDEHKGELCMKGGLCLDVYDKNSDYVTCWQRNNHANQKWTLVPTPAAPAAAAPAEAAAPAAVSAPPAAVASDTPAEADLVLKDVSENPSMFIITASGGKFRLPVFLGPSVRLTTKQRAAQPTLVMSEVDWNFVKDPNVTHEGAFGSDYEKWSEHKVEQRWVHGFDMSKTKWVLVWKFPGDLNHIPGFQPIFDLPLPVGAYPFYDDRWCSPPASLSIPELPINEVAVEKLRFDKAKGAGVHCLESVENGTQVAMIGSHYFIAQFWGETDEERKNVVKLLQALYKAGVYAFPCYGQHHAIVFYVDLKSRTLITPKAFAELLKTNDAVFEALHKHNQRSEKQLLSWKHNYINQPFKM